MGDRAGGPGDLSYDPERDVAQRYPGWVVAQADLGGVIPEVLSMRRRVILLDSGLDAEQRRSSLAHAIAHIDLGHGETLPGWFEAREEAEADALAARRLVPLEALLAAVSWSTSRSEIARDLGVDDQMLAARERILTRAERARLRRCRRGAGWAA